MKNCQLQPGRSLYLSIRAAFIRQGTSLAAWCREHRYNQSNVAASLMGSWNGQLVGAFGRKQSGIQGFLTCLSA
jgi:gp16 family phage-associated protein